ncbi:hypothetical protein YC2023_114227 [Brassica napus]
MNLGVNHEQPFIIGGVAVFVGNLKDMLHALLAFPLFSFCTVKILELLENSRDSSLVDSSKQSKEDMSTRKIFLKSISRCIQWSP